MGTGLVHIPCSETGSTCRGLTPFSMEAEEKKAGPLYPFFSKMWKTKIPKWMALPKTDGRRMKLSLDPLPGKD